MRKVTLDKNKFIKRDHFASSTIDPKLKNKSYDKNSGEWSISEDFSLDDGYDTLVYIRKSSPVAGN
ncbi:hypothetical protein [Citrobacter braakii]|uniref:hypothetical protein n=1 Tax=Citrobacter braakii TaxID=57706 RepID=UPI001299FD74|nr:hypothetical protein [Citrobacter braakii]MEB8063594.1 hypothetical protein [Citrobacter braakii]MRE78206.1 hypothetical protein [Citrobacter braakii]